jgi:octaprenyl-diphosphate synthase
VSTQAELLALLEPVESGLERMRAVMTEQLEDASRAVGDLTAHVGRFRGKQLRGALVLLVGEATGNSHSELPQVAAVVELIHLATLVHDDILDGAEVRRRVACINQRWDNQVAVLLGDFLYARAFALSTDLSSPLASRLLSETTRRLCVGEIEQSARRYDFEQTFEQIERVAAAKTASLYSAAAELGARYPDGDPALAERMGAFGHEIGLAFQLVDDCLDLVGETDQLGKSVGTDVEDGKITLPVRIAYAEADEATRARMRDLFTLPGLEERARKLRLECDLEAGVSRTLARAKELVEQARGRLHDLAPSAARTALEDLSTFVLSRRA